MKLSTFIQLPLSVDSAFKNPLYAAIYSDADDVVILSADSFLICSLSTSLIDEKLGAIEYKENGGDKNQQLP